MTTQNDNERARAKEIFLTAFKRMEAEKIEPTAAFEAMVTLLRDWGLQMEDGHEVLLNAAAFLQRNAIQAEVIAGMVPVPMHTAN